MQQSPDHTRRQRIERPSLNKQINRLAHQDPQAPRNAERRLEVQIARERDGRRDSLCAVDESEKRPVDAEDVVDLVAEGGGDVGDEGFLRDVEGETVEKAAEREESSCNSGTARVSPRA